MKTMIRRVKEQKLTYLSDERLVRIASLCMHVERKRIPGMIIEAGCALGGSSIVIAATKAKSRELRVYDVFGMIPPPSEKDQEDVHKRYDVIRSGKSKGIDGDAYYGYVPNLYERVVESFREAGYAPEENSVRLVKGLLQETLNVNESVSLAHIDVDWYDPVHVSLERIVPHVSRGGSIILDDYLDWSGCRQAVDDYFRGREDSFRFDTSSGSLLVRKL